MPILDKTSALIINPDVLFQGERNNVTLAPGADKLFEKFLSLGLKFGMLSYYTRENINRLFSITCFRYENNIVIHYADPFSREIIKEKFANLVKDIEQSFEGVYKLPIFITNTEDFMEITTDMSIKTILVSSDRTPKAQYRVGSLLEINLTFVDDMFKPRHR